MILLPRLSTKGAEFACLSWEEFDNAPSPRLLKTHAPPPLLLGMCDNDSTSHITLPIGTKIIVVSRNPLDACVSRYYHAFNPHKLGWSFDAWAALWLSGNTTYGMILSTSLLDSHPICLLLTQHLTLLPTQTPNVHHQNHCCLDVMDFVSLAYTSFPGDWFTWVSIIAYPIITPHHTKPNHFYTLAILLLHSNLLFLFAVVR